MSREEMDWETLVIISIIILATIVLFKFMFWISLVALLTGIVWLAYNVLTEDHHDSWIPLLMILVSLILAPISYQIGYRFEKTELGGAIVDSAEVIVQTDQELREIEDNITQELVGAMSELAIE